MLGVQVPPSAPKERKDIMYQMIAIAKLYNIITSKLMHTQVPMSIANFHDMVELAGETEVRIRDCLKQLHKKGMVRRVPIPAISGKNRVGYEWTDSKRHKSTEPGEVKVIALGKLAPPPLQLEDHVRIKVNKDHSVTLILRSIRITIEVQE